MDAAVEASIHNRNAKHGIVSVVDSPRFSFARFTHGRLHFFRHALLIFLLGEQSAGLRSKSFNRKEPTDQAVDQSFAKRLTVWDRKCSQGISCPIPIVFLDTIGIFSVKLEILRKPWKIRQ